MRKFASEEDETFIRHMLRWQMDVDEALEAVRLARVVHAEPEQGDTKLRVRIELGARSLIAMISERFPHIQPKPIPAITEITGSLADWLANGRASGWLPIEGDLQGWVRGAESGLLAIEGEIMARTSIIDEKARQPNDGQRAALDFIRKNPRGVSAKEIAAIAGTSEQNVRRWCQQKGKNGPGKLYKAGVRHGDGGYHMRKT